MKMKLRKCEYTAIKVKCFNHWIWFKTDKIINKNGIFTGVEGWGLDGNFTEIEINSMEIIGTIVSDFPQYR